MSPPSVPSPNEDFPKKEQKVLLQLVSRVRQALDRLSVSLTRWHDIRTGQKDENYYAWLGWQVLIWGFGVFLVWAVVAPIDKGVSASGWVITDSNRKSIQPASSGIIDDILVREGQQVVTGQVLVKLNPINAQAQTNATKETISGLQSQVQSLTQSIAQKRQQSAVLAKQLAGLRQLAKDGYVAENKVRELERQQHQLLALISEDEGTLIRTQKQISELEEKLNPYEYDLANTELKSPVDGEVVNIQVFTKGGVVTPAQKLMEVIPNNEGLIVEGQLQVHLVDKVRVGLPVEMMFTAFNVNRTPHIPGTVLSVGADRVIEEKSGAPYYKVQIQATPEGVELLGQHKVKPGMPVELFIKTGEQTLMTYLLKPFFDRAHSALRED